MGFHGTECLDRALPLFRSVISFFLSLVKLRDKPISEQRAPVRLTELSVRGRYTVVPDDILPIHLIDAFNKAELM